MKDVCRKRGEYTGYGFIGSTKMICRPENCQPGFTLFVFNSFVDGCRLVSSRCESTATCPASTSTTTTIPCVHATPAVTITPASNGGTAGSPLTYDVSVRNNDASCGSETYSLSSSGTACTSPWYCSAMGPLTIASGSSASTTITVTSPSSASPGSNAFSVTASIASPSHTGTGTATYVVSDFTVAATSTIFVTKPQSGSRDGTGTITIGSVNGFSSAVSLSGAWFDLNNNPLELAGVTVSYATASVTPPADRQSSSALAITVPSEASTGTFILRTTGTKAKSHSADTKVIISSHGLEFTPKSDTYALVDYVWGSGRGTSIKVRDKSELSGSPQIAYDITSKTRTGACDVSNTDIFDADGKIMTQFKIKKGETITNPFRIRAKATDDSFCTFSFKILAPDGAEVDPAFTVNPTGPVLPPGPVGMNIKVTYPFVEKKLIPLIGTKPDFTKSMPIQFLVKANSLDLLPVDCTFDNCQVGYGIKEKDGTVAVLDGAVFPTCAGNEYKPGQCIAFDKFTPIGPAWKAQRPSKDPLNGAIDLACDADYTLVVKTAITSGLGVGSSGTLETPLHINCKPRVTIDPPEKSVVLNQNNADAFTATVWDPEIRSYSLDMANAKREHVFLAGADRWIEFVCSPPAVCSADKLHLSNIQSGSEVPPQFTVRLTSKAATRAGNFPVRFTASALGVTPAEAEATIKVFAEGLNEFALWQLAVLVILSMILVYRHSGSKKRI